MKSDDFGDRMNQVTRLKLGVFATFDVETDARNFVKEVQERGWADSAAIEDCINHVPAGVCPKDGPFDEWWDIDLDVTIPGTTVDEVADAIELGRPYTDLLVDLAYEKYHAHHARVASIGAGPTPDDDFDD